MTEQNGYLNEVWASVSNRFAEEQAFADSADMLPLPATKEEALNAFISDVCPAYMPAKEGDGELMFLHFLNLRAIQPDAEVLESENIVITDATVTFTGVIYPSFLLESYSYKHDPFLQSLRDYFALVLEAPVTDGEDTIPLSWYGKTYEPETPYDRLVKGISFVKAGHVTVEFRTEADMETFLAPLVAFHGLKGTRNPQG